MEFLRHLGINDCPKVVGSTIRLQIAAHEGGFDWILDTRQLATLENLTKETPVAGE